MVLQMDSLLGIWALLTGAILGARYLYLRHKIGKLSIPELRAYLEKQKTMAQWEILAKCSCNENSGQSSLPPSNVNPMYIALVHREVIARLVKSGHGHAGKGVLDEVDAIIATIAANHKALEYVSFGQWVENGKRNEWGSLLHTWVPNKDPFFQELHKSTFAMVAQLEALNKHVQEISLAGVQSSAETAKVQLQVHKQDLDAETTAMLEVGKELTERPL